jgi:hypothetical protein
MAGERRPLRKVARCSFLRQQGYAREEQKKRRREARQRAPCRLPPLPSPSPRHTEPCPKAATAAESRRMLPECVLPRQFGARPRRQLRHTHANASRDGNAR